MAGAKGSSRVNGRNGEAMSIEGETICFKTVGKTYEMPLEVVAGISIENTEGAREAVNTEDLVPYGAWTKEMPSVGGKSVFVVVKGHASLWVMEITKNQVPNASSFVERVRPQQDEGESKLRIPNRVINTPLGALFTVGSIVCIILAVFLVYSWQQPLLGLVAAVAGTLMYINIK